MHQFGSLFLTKTLLDLRNSSKWQEEQHQLVGGDLVIEIDANQPRGSWMLAVIEQVHPSDDAKACKVTILNSKGP